MVQHIVALEKKAFFFWDSGRVSTGFMISDWAKIAYRKMLTSRAQNSLDEDKILFIYFFGTPWKDLLRDDLALAKGSFVVNVFSALAGRIYPDFGTAVTDSVLKVVRGVSGRES